MSTEILAHKISARTPSADNDNYDIGLTIAEGKAVLDEIKRLKKAIEDFGKNPAGFDWAILMKLDDLEAENYKLKAKHRWIPVGERLPDESGLYQALRKINQLPTTREYCAKSLMWMSQDTVTHWKPIILPEKGGE